MVFAVLVAMTLAAGPGEAKVFNVAAPGLSAAESDSAKADFLNDYLAEQLSKEGSGQIRVITANEVAAVLGNERQRQLLGCSDNAGSCIAELAGALGSDAVIVGNIARFGSSYAMTVKVISATDASTLASTSVRDLKEDQLPAWMARAAKELAKKLAPPPEKTVAASANAGSPAPTARPTEAKPVGTDAPSVQPQPDYKNSVWLTVTSYEYDRRIKGNTWLGARFTPWAVSFWNPYTQYGQLVAIARHHPMSRGQGFNYSVYAGVGVAYLHQEAQVVSTGLIGGEFGYKWIRASLELNAFSLGPGEFLFGVTPGLSAAIPF